jgi:hypothetical protein
MKVASVETAVNDFRNAGISHWIQTFLSNWMFQPSENTDLPLAEVAPHPKPMAVGNGCNDVDCPHIRIQWCPRSLLLKSQENPAFSQISTKPLSKYHYKVFSISHTSDLASNVDVNTLRKVNKEELQHEITDTSKESTQRQRKPVNKVEKPVKNDEDE